jgi:hypothetical protein
LDLIYWGAKKTNNQKKKETGRKHVLELMATHDGRAVLKIEDRKEERN